MNFRTRVDFTNRQTKQYEKTNINLSGGTVFGLPYSALTSGPDLTLTGITFSNVVLQSTYSGDTGTTVYSFGDSRMYIDEGDLSPLTPSNSGTTQYAGPTWTGYDMFTTVDGYTGWSAYSAVTYDLNVLTMVDLGHDSYSGVVESNFVVYSATSLDYTGSIIWVDVSGVTRTNELIISNLTSTDPLATNINGKVVSGVSDARLKENIEPISGALNKIRQLRGVSFNYTDASEMGNGLRYGFIAQEVQPIIPEIVRNRPNSDNMLNLNYTEIVPWLVEAVKELFSGSTIIDNQKINTQTITSEDNNIVLNYNGNHESSLGGGINVLHSVSTGIHSEFKTDENGNWIVSPSLKPIMLTVPEYTPKSTDDKFGKIGDIVWGDNYIYIKRNNGWGRCKLENF